MTTSLATQLKKLAVPQSAVFHKDRKRASLLFDPKEAANLDRDTVFELGLQGLKELIKLAPVFSDFENTLFDASSKDLQRAVQTKETNEKLDREIQRFFFHLSPFFLLKSAHQSLEWLINRFQIHLYNVDDLMVLLLPFHESVIFVRALQLIDVKEPGGRWHWLYPSQREGVGLSKLALLNHCAQNSSFFNFVCEIPLRAVKLCGSYCETLTTMFMFCCTTIIGALEYSSQVTDVQVGHVLKFVLKSFTSEFIEVCAVGIMITAQLARRTKLAGNILRTLVNKIVQVSHEKLEMERTVLLVLLYDSQQETLTSISHKALLKLAESKSFLRSLAELGDSHADVAQLLIVLIQDAMKGVMLLDETSAMLKQFCSDILATVTLEDEDAEALVLSVANLYITKDAMDEENASDMEIDEDDEICEWFSSYLRDLEKQYPKAFDVAMKKVLDATQDEVMRKNLLAIVGFKPRISCLISGVDVFEKLNHPLEAMRVEGVRFLLTNHKKFQDDDNEFLVQAMRNRLQDDSISVLSEVLEFPTPLLASIVGKDFFLELMINIATKMWYDMSMRKDLKKKIIHCLCSDVLLETNEHAVTLAVLLYVLPCSYSELYLAEKVLKSEFGSKNNLLKGVLSGLPRGLTDPSELCQLVFERMCDSECIPDVNTLEEVMDSMSIFETEPVYKFLGSILLVSAVKNVVEAEMKWKIVDKLLKYYDLAEMSSSTSETPFKLTDSDGMIMCMSVAAEKTLPIQGLMFCLSTLSKHLELPEKVLEHPWWHIATKEKSFEINNSLLFIRLFGVLLKYYKLRNSLSREFFSLSGKLVKKCFADENSQLGFLSNLWMAHELGEVHEAVVTEIVQLRALELACMLLRSSEQVGKECKGVIVPPLLIALCSPSVEVRKNTVTLISLLTQCGESSGSEDGYTCLLRKVLEQKEEILIDPEQVAVCLYSVLSPDPAVQSLVPSKERRTLAEARKALFDCVVHESTPLHMKAALLRILAHVNSVVILETLVPVGREILRHASRTGNTVDCYRSAVFCSIISRFNSSVTECLEENDEVWEFFETSIKDFTTVMNVDGNDIHPAVIVMNQVSKMFYDALSGRKQSLLFALVAVATDADSPEVVSGVGHVVKRIVLDCRHVVAVLEKMRDVKADPKSRKAASSPGPTVAILKTPAWRRGTALLELIQNKKKLNSIHLIVPVLFDILKRCLDCVEQASVEYVKQLILSCILNCCTKLSSEKDDLSDTALEGIFNVELVVKCIRASPNPQTHHHALLLLSHLATLLPEQVLHNIMAIFTFMGSSVLRQDDAYSFQIISEVVDAVIPVLMKVQETDVNYSKLYDPVASILRVFVDAYTDIPEHRQMPLFHKLMATIGPEHYFWLLMALLIESQARQKPGTEKKEDGFLPKRLTFAVNISLQFSPAVVIANSVTLMEYLILLSIDKEQKAKWCRKGRRGIAAVTALFNVAQSSKSQFHHFKYAVVAYLCGTLGHPDFISMVAVLPVEEAKEMESIYAELIENILQHIQIVAHANELNVGKPTAKYWKAMLNQSYELMDRVNALLLSDMFLKVILKLLGNSILTVRRKAMELMNARLQNQEFFTSCKSDDLLAMTKPLLNIISTIGEENSSLDHQLNQQTALTSVKLLARLLATKHAEVFASVFDDLTTLIKMRAPKGNVLASAMLCAAQLCSSLDAHAIRTLPNFMPLLLKVLSKEKQNKNPDVVFLAMVTALYKIVESLPNFLSPYLKQILLEISVLCARFQGEAEIQKTASIVQKLKFIKQTLSSEIPLRILVPVVHKCYSELLKKKEVKAVSPLMDVLVSSFSNMSNADFKNLKTEITNFFMAALQFRSDNAEGDISEDEIEFVETHVIRALVALVVKLSESSFRPLYYNMYHWATALDIHKERLITFYRVSHGVAECLKGLFVLFAGHFIKNAATVLEQTNVTKSESLIYGTGQAAEERSIVLLESVLKTLHSIFLYDSANFLTKERFDTLMQPLVDQMENTLGGKERLRERSKSLLMPCIVQFGFVATDDTLWKQLNYQILLKMRHSSPVVRLIALDTLHGLASRLREDFLPQLPETVPFLAELLEDEEEEVETACVRVVQDLEEILGEPLKKYF